MSDMNCLDMMQMYAVDAVTLASRLGNELNYSEDSLAIVEEILAMYHKSLTDEVTEDQIGLMSLTWGGYVGEVMRRQLGGEWIMEKEMVKLVIKNTEYFPTGVTYLRIKEGPEQSITDYYASIKNGMQLLM